MIKFEKKVQPPKKPEKQDENRFDQINDAANEKRKQTQKTDTSSGPSIPKGRGN